MTLKQAEDAARWLVFLPAMLLAIGGASFCEAEPMAFFGVFVSGATALLALIKCFWGGLFGLTGLAAVCIGFMGWARDPSIGRVIVPFTVYGLISLGAGAIIGLLLTRRAIKKRLHEHQNSTRATSIRVCVLVVVTAVVAFSLLSPRPYHIILTLGLYWIWCGLLAAAGMALFMLGRNLRQRRAGSARTGVQP